MVRQQIVGRFVFDDADKRGERLLVARAIPAARPPSLTWPAPFLVAVAMTTAVLWVLSL